MSREIKFRCFNKDDDYGMFYGGFSIHATAGKFQPDSLLNDAENGDYVVMQFTGLTDKNGKDIYEGDLVLARDVRICEVIFHKYAGCWDLNLVKVLTDDTTCSMSPALYGYHAEVIGNIHENPELMEG